MGDVIRLKFAGGVVLLLGVEVLSPPAADGSRFKLLNIRMQRDGQDDPPPVDENNNTVVDEAAAPTGGTCPDGGDGDVEMKLHLHDQPATRQMDIVNLTQRQSNSRQRG